MSFVELGILSTLAAFGIGSLLASALVLVVWSVVEGRLENVPAASRARLLLGLRLFPTAAGLATTASSSCATVIEINLAATELTARADIALSGPAGEVLPRLLQALDHG